MYIIIAMDGQSLDIKQNNLAALREMFPHVFSEDRIDEEKFKAAFGDNINIHNERYTLNWAGKAAAFRTLQERTTATLKPQPELSVNFDSTENVFIEGENLEVLKILQKSYFNKIKCIVIDPPYNTGNDSFIYPDRFKENLEEYEKRIGERDEDGYLMKEGLFRKNSKENGHYHSNWLSMMLPRLFLARNLMKDDGVIFVHIDDNEVHNLRLLMNEIFGEENFVYQLSVVDKLNGNDNSSGMMETQEYCLIYAKNKTNFEIGVLPIDDDTSNWQIDDIGFWKEGGGIKATGVAARREDRPNLFYPLYINEKTLEFSLEKSNSFTFELIPKIDGADGRWTWAKEKFIKDANEVIIKKVKDGYSVYKKQRPALGDMPCKRGKTTFYNSSYSTANSSAEIKALFGGQKVFDFSKSTNLIKDLISLANTNKDSTILDFFAGSATTAQAVLELNKEDSGSRKFILVQLPELCAENSEAGKAGYKTIADISRERIRRVTQKIGEGGFKSFKLSPSNFKVWRGEDVTDESAEKQLDAFIDPVKTESAPQNMLVELILKFGYQLTDKVEDNGRYYSVNGNELIIALTKMDLEIAAEIMELQPKPQKVIVLDRLFAGNDGLKASTALQMKDAGVGFRTV